VTYLFGGQYRQDSDRTVRPAALVLDGALRLPDRLCDLLRAKPRVAWAAAFRKPGVAIDPRTGAAEERKLRFEEMTRGGVTLTGRAQVDVDGLSPEQRDAALALLAAGARLLESIGGKRRRGAGRCRLTLGIAPDLEILSRPDAPPPPEPRPYDVPDRPLPPADEAGTGWDRAELLITVREPVLVAATVKGNLAEGADHLPGWCLMPEVTRRLGGPAHALVRTGDLVVTAALPLSPGGAATLPVPRVLVHEKGGNQVVGNRMAGDAAEGKPFRDRYVVLDGAEAGRVVKPEATMRMHNTVNDETQRPTEDVGGVYIYQALAPGTMLRAEVRARAGLLESGWPKRLAGKGKWRIGRSAKDDYGLVSVEARAVTATRPPSAPVAAGGALRVWLLSDLLVRDQRLRPSTDPADVARVLADALAKAGAPGVGLAVVGNPARADTPAGGDQSEGAATAMAVGVRRTESWHRGWRLPRSTLYGLAAGSCLTFQVTEGDIPAAVLDEIRAAGLGERRAEGFGQVEFDHPLLTRSFAGKNAGPPPDTPESSSPGEIPLLEPDDPGYASARVFERAAWREAVHRACEEFMADPGRRARLFPNKLTTSQLNRLRNVVEQPTIHRAERVLTQVAEKRAGRPIWPEHIIDALRGLLTEPDRIWTTLDLPESDLTVTRDGVAELRAELGFEAVRVLITTCLAAEGRARATEGSPE
jgi:CRISPR-associated protein Csx10